VSTDDSRSHDTKQEPNSVHFGERPSQAKELSLVILLVITRKLSTAEGSEKRGSVLAPIIGTT
jgi:hypothetical protein